MKTLKHPLWTALAVLALTAAPAAADQVILDDLIVDGSICAGLDCVNGESFGFDTLRLKENNLRIRFFDTSSSASFPTRDWQITANDSSNGGREKFSIDDIDGGRTPFTLEAGAPSHSLYVDDGGRLGLGTSTPVSDIHVVSGNTPTLRLEQNGSSGFTAQTWDVAGNEANFFIRDATNGSTLPFRIRPGATTDSIEIRNDGDVHVKNSLGVGITDPLNALHMVKAGAAAILMDDTSAPANESVAQMFVTTTGDFHIRGLNDAFTQTAAGVHIDISDGNVGIGCINSASDLTVGTGNNSCTAAGNSSLTAGDTMFTMTSSRTLKKNLEPVQVEGLLAKMSEIGVYTYDFIDGPEDKMGLMAEDFHQVFGRGSDKKIKGDDVQMALWLAVQELAARLEAVEGECAE